MSQTINFLAIAACLCALQFPSISAADDWWKLNPNIYQISTLSFKDFNGDGHGDIRGIISKLDYLVETGIDVLLLTPFYESPMVDLGYDISNYTAVDAIFGTVIDVEDLIASAKERGLRIILDFVPNHTSVNHEWFRKSENGEKGYEYFYVFHDGSANMNYERPMHPNYWVSEYGGFSWTWSEKREAYYYHKFSEHQADLNLRENRVILELNKVLEFWLDKGIDGFRIDAASELFEDPAYLDVPDKAKDLPQTYELISKWRKLLDDYAEAKGTEPKILIPQIWNSPLNDLVAYYQGDKPQVPTNFMLINELTASSNVADFKRVIDSYLKALPENATPSWILGTHNHNRVASRMGKERIDSLMILLQTLPGISFTYNGDELGMEDHEISWEDTRDIWACNAHVENYREMSRDPARTPFQWDSTENAGFSTATFTWLPVNPSYNTTNLQSQMTAERSHYKLYKDLLQLRRNATFVNGSFDSTVLGTNVFSYARTYAGNSFVVAINFGDSEEEVDISGLGTNLREESKIHLTSSTSDHKTGDIVNIKSIQLKPYDAVIISYSSASKVALSLLAVLMMFIKMLV